MAQRPSPSSAEWFTVFWLFLAALATSCRTSRIAPDAGTLTPTSGATNEQVFTATYVDRGDGLRTVSILFDTAVNGAHACWVEYNTHNDAFTSLSNDPGAGFLSLRTDDGTRFLEPIPADSTEEQSNTQCTISARGFHASRSGRVLTVQYPLRFSPAFRGARHVYLLASSDYAFSGWQERGTWQVP